MPQHRILIVEDDPEMRALLVEGIDTSHEFRLTTAATCSAAQALVGREHFDIVVLDLGLPDVEGCDGVSTLRESFSGPILVLSGRSAECDVVSALEAGATDYVNKPFRFPILIARIRAQIRAAEAANSTVFKVGPYTYRATARMLVTANGSKLKLTEKESAILQYLHRSGSKNVSRDMLLREVWGYSRNVCTHTLETHIYRLRQKLDISAQGLIVTEPGGYRLAR